MISAATTVRVPEQKTGSPVTGNTEVATEAPSEQSEKQPQGSKPQRKRPMALIVAGLGIGAIAAISTAQAAVKEAQAQLAASKGGLQQAQAGNVQTQVNRSQYWVVANFKETQLEAMKPGQLVEIKLDTFPHHPFTGRVNSIFPASGAQFALLSPDNATGNFTKIVQRIPVKVIFDPQSIRGYESRIAPGMSARVNVELK